jgi:PAS domain S-box-containing protein
MPKFSESDLLSSPCFFPAILNSLGEAVLITDLEDRILYGNRALEEMLGYRLKDIRHRFAYEVFLDEPQWSFMRKQNHERATGEDAYYKVKMKTRAGELRTVRVHATPLMNENGEIHGTIGSMIDCEKEEALMLENAVMRDELTALKGRQRIIGESAAVKFVQEQIDRVAATDANVLILGESGSGKELVASAIHERSPRAKSHIVRVNCAAIPKELFESEFFGHLKGAFTGAVKTRMGRFELADKSTLFLDEVGEIPLDMQGKLLRAIQEGTFERIGDDKTRTVDVRIIAATNKDLGRAVKSGQFREDLYYRLNVFPLTVPPLRERGDDVLLLVDFFLERLSKRMGRSVPFVSDMEKDRLAHYDWPGNIRELENVVERALILQGAGEPISFPLAAGSIEEPSAVDDRGREQVPKTMKAFRETEIAMIRQALKERNGKVHGKGGAAELLGMKPTTLASRIKKLGIR